jgi:hypothetical protein
MKKDLKTLSFLCDEVLDSFKPINIQELRQKENTTDAKAEFNKLFISRKKSAPRPFEFNIFEDVIR